MPFRRLAVAIVATLSASASFAAASGDAIVPKQLSGPPEEFAELAPADPVEATIHSKSALLPVELSADASGARHWSGVLPVENGRARFLVFGGEHDAWQAELVAPDGGATKSAASVARRVDAAEFGMQEELQSADYYALDGVASGAWTLKLRGDAQSAARGFVLIEGDDATQLASHQTHKRQRAGERIGIVAQLSGIDAKDAVVLGNAAGRIARATLRVTAPDGAIETFAMADDGRHDDGAAGDGLFGGDFLAERSGTWLAQVLVEAKDRGGQSLLRSAEHVIPIVDASLSLAGEKARGGALSGSRLAIEVPVTADKRGQHYRTYAEVWGRDAAGNDVPVAWVGGMVTPDQGKLALGFDARWVQRAGAKAPFELRNLRIEDPDHFVTLAEAKRLALTLPAIRGKARGETIAIDATMRMGPRPAPGNIAKGVGTRLLLVHGYCSGGVWPTGHFSNASTFLDVNQNRSHDQFAQRIKTFGNTWNSYGIVAHSQGGAAALHLYNYYWSGLDNATGARLIQSVGTPYKGTNLAGILATLGSWFGVGCGTNDNLSYSGATAWLAGIPNSSRAKVNYYTTAFRTTNWCTNDYCNFATDLVLSDPEDGTTEQANGQLGGATNRGHTSGQCHTSGMRDPAQYNDAGRNGTMNSNAAR
jgi:hypothetical protein